MKPYLPALALMCVLASPAQAANPACDRKADEIARQIQHAQTAGNRNREKGLQKALAATRTQCTDAQLISDLKRDIEEQQEEIEDLQADILEKGIPKGGTTRPRNSSASWKTHTKT